MGWGQSPGQELAAQRAAQLAVEQAARRDRMSPFEQQLLEVLGETRHILGEIHDALTRPAVTDAAPRADDSQLAGGETPTPAGEHHTLGPECRCGRALIPVWTFADLDALDSPTGFQWVHRGGDQTPACVAPKVRPGRFIPVPFTCGCGTELRADYSGRTYHTADGTPSCPNTDEFSNTP